MQTKRTFKISSNFEASEKWTLIIFRKWFMPDHRGNSETLIGVNVNDICTEIYYPHRLSISFICSRPQTSMYPWSTGQICLPPRPCEHECILSIERALNGSEFPISKNAFIPFKQIFSVTWNLQIVAEKIWWTHRNSPNSVFLKYTFFICCSTLTSYKF